MNQLYPTFPSGELRSSAHRAFEMSDNGPVVIMNRATPRAIMISPEMWNQTAARLSELEGLIQAMEIASRSDDTVDFEELCKDLGFDPKRLATSPTTAT